MTPKGGGRASGAKDQALAPARERYGEMGLFPARVLSSPGTLHQSLREAGISFELQLKETRKKPVPDVPLGGQRFREGPARAHGVARYGTRSWHGAGPRGFGPRDALRGARTL